MSAGETPDFPPLGGDGRFPGGASHHDPLPRVRYITLPDSAPRDLLEPNPLGSAVTVLITGSLILAAALLWKPKKSSRLTRIIPVAVAIVARVWSLVVSYFVPEPYLDEIFHIPQAKEWCVYGRYSKWDDKITTPPGLYIISCMLPRTIYFGALTGYYGCDPASLRAVNALALAVLVYLAMLCRHQIESRLLESHSPSTRIGAISSYAAHTSLNIALFPALFFFSGMYYTDVLSTVTVLAAFSHSLGRMARVRSSFVSDVVTILLGIVSLFMRQTNVFWVVVFLGGLEAIHAVKTLRPERVEGPQVKSAAEHFKYVLWRWSLGDVHDPPLSTVWPDDLLYVAISLCVAAVANLPRVLRQIWPHVAVLAAFTVFVIWNGGVVLGDKSNHVATIHLAQMLYIWAFFAFFSIPLLIPYALLIPNKALKLVLPGSEGQQPEKPNQKNQAYELPRAFSLLSQAISALYYVSTIVLSIAIVKFNTIIHPFTLADNRHYMFYIFRYTIRRAPWIRYALIAPYTVGRWLVWDTLGGCGEWTGNGQGRSRFINHPLVLNKTSPSKPSPEKPTKDQLNQKTAASVEDSLRHATQPVSASTGIVLLLAAALSLVTAPLVEPRYFIIPWVMWRLLVPAWRLHDGHPGYGFLSQVSQESALGRLIAVLKRHDGRLLIETLWFIAINAGTAYIFLFKPYQWRSEDGKLLDEGRLQRFLW